MDAAEAAVERLWPGRHPRVTALDGGITNRNFKVEVDGEILVLRLGGVKTDLLGIDRRVEHAAGVRAAELGIGPAVVRFVEPEGWLVARFIDGRPMPPETMRTPEVLTRVASVLKRLHESAAIPGRFDSHAVVDAYRVEAEAHGVTIPAAFKQASEISERIRAARGEQPTVPCHNDLLNANFLDDGEIRIVDWEYAGMGDRFFDLANLSVNHGFGLDDDRRLAAAYFGRDSAAHLASIRLMRFMSDFREAMWGVLQSGISELDFDFDAYAAKHFTRMLATAAEPDFAAYLKSVRNSS